MTAVQECLGGVGPKLKADISKHETRGCSPFLGVVRWDPHLSLHKATPSRFEAGFKPRDVMSSFSSRLTKSSKFIIYNL